MSTTRWKVAAGVALALSASACAPSYNIIGMADHPERNLTITDSEGQGADEAETLFNLYIRLCDIDGNRQANCVESLLLTSIDPNQDSNPIHWHDQETFYVAHNATDISGIQNVTIQVPQPYVKMCKVQSNNAVACADQIELNRLLEPTM